MLKNKKYIILLIVVLILLLGGATYAWYVWNSSNNENINVSLTASSVITFDGGTDISGIIEPTLTKEEGIIKTFSITSASSGDRFSLYMDIKSLPEEYKQTYFYWEVYNGSTLVNSNDFHSYSTGDEILLMDDILISNGSTDTYTIYFWIDASVPNNGNIASKTVELSIHASGTSGAVLEVPGSASEYITNLYKKATKTQYTDSKYNITYNYAESINLMNDRLASMDTDINAGNIRYYGADPDNYVSFNNELWRIIGVFNGRLKLIRKDSIGTYSWDTSTHIVNEGYGVNQWGPSVHLDDDTVYDGANLMKLLNPGYNNNTDNICSTTLTNGKCGENDESLITGLVNNSLYWNASSTGKCYTGRIYTASNCNFSSSGLRNDTSKVMIDEVIWHLGSNSKNEDPWDGNTTASRLYNWEHSNNSGIQCTLNSSYCSSDVRGATTWVGKVGLMSPSDYAYATGGGTTHNLNTCLSTHNAYVENNSGILNWGNTYTDCKNNDWLLDTSSWQWTIAPRTKSDHSDITFAISALGNVSYNNTGYAGSVRPVVFLNPNVKFIGGTGTSTEPYILASA